VKNSRNAPRRSATIIPLAGKVPANRKQSRKGEPRWFKVTLVALPLAAASAVFMFDGPPPAEAVVLPVQSQPAVTMPVVAAPADLASGSFAKCNDNGWNCVVDGDTIRYEGVKIRIADINTPETFEARCPSERALGNRATERMIDLLNPGNFSLEPVDREVDQYGRTLRVITRNGESLGDTLVDEGLAERWNGQRRQWC
jgi:endonuclease YncB( thermonuclease family)